MPSADPAFTWQEDLIGFATIAGAAFLVTWVFTDVLRIRRTPYIAVLFVVVHLAVEHLATRRHAA